MFYLSQKLISFLIILEKVAGPFGITIAGKPWYSGGPGIKLNFAVGHLVTQESFK